MGGIHNVFEWLSSNEKTIFPFSEDSLLTSTSGIRLPPDLLIDAVATGGDAETVLYLSRLTSSATEVNLFFKVEGDGLVVAEFSIPRTSASVRKMFYSAPVDPLKGAPLVSPIPGLASSGAGTPGTLDPNFALVESPSTLLAYILLPPLNATWAAAPAGSAWIGPDVPAAAPSRPAGLYKYELTLDLTGIAFEELTIQGELLSDNESEIFVNGVSSGITAPHAGFGGPPIPFLLPASLFVEDAINTIQIWVTNTFSTAGANPTGFVAQFPDPYSAASVSPGAALPPGSINTLTRRLPPAFDMKIVVGPAVLTLPLGLDLAFDASEASLEAATVHPQPLMVQSLADFGDLAAVPLRLTGDVRVGDGWNMGVDLNEETGVLTFTAAAGAGLGVFTDCSPFEEAPRKLRLVDGREGDPSTRSFTIEGDDCIEVQNRPEDNMIIIHNHCRPCCDCSLLAVIDTRLSSLE